MLNRDEFIKLRVDPQAAATLDRIANRQGRTKASVVRWLLHLAAEAGLDAPGPVEKLANAARGEVKK